MANALSIHPSADMDIQTLGQVLVKSGYFQDSRDASQAIVKVLAGRELGLGPIASMTGIYIVKGRVTLSANLIAAAIKKSKRYDYRVSRMDNEGCEIVFFQDGQEIGRSTFDKNDALAAGLASGDNWKKFPRNMYFARALSNGAKWFTPDVFSGPIYTPDELGAEVDGETGEVIEATIVTPEPPARQTPRRQIMLGRINGMFNEAKDRRLSLPDEIALTDPEQLTDGELQVFGVKFREVLNAAEAVNA